MNQHPGGVPESSILFLASLRDANPSGSHSGGLQPPATFWQAFGLLWRRDVFDVSFMLDSGGGKGAGTAQESSERFIDKLGG